MKNFIQYLELFLDDVNDEEQVFARPGVDYIWK